MGRTGSARPPLTPAVFHVLVALADGPAHGYAIMKAAEEAAGFVMGPGTVYGTLSRLEESGLVEETSGPRDARQRRRYWRMTAAGRAALRAESVRLAALADLVRAKKLVPVR